MANLRRRPTMSDQQKRRDQSLYDQQRPWHPSFLGRYVGQFPDSSNEALRSARFLAYVVLSPSEELELEPDTTDINADQGSVPSTLQASSSQHRPGTRQWFANQFMLPEQMIDVPDDLSTRWFVIPIPAGKRCFVVSSDGTTVSRTTDGTVLHRFPSFLPNGGARSWHSWRPEWFCILDCIFHEPDQTYYVLSPVFWGDNIFSNWDTHSRFIELYNCLDETEPFALDYCGYRFENVSASVCHQSGLQRACSQVEPYVNDGLMFYHLDANYHAGITPLALMWKDKDQHCNVANQREQMVSEPQVVLELLNNGNLVTWDDPRLVLARLDEGFIGERRLQPGNLFRFVISDGNLSFVDGNHAQADTATSIFADTYPGSIVQYIAWHFPVKMEHLLASIGSPTSAFFEIRSTRHRVGMEMID